MELVRTKLGWLEEFRASLEEWSTYLAMINGTLGLVRCRGLTVSVGQELEAMLPPAAGSVGEFARNPIEFVVDESSKVRQGERLPGTTEVLESCFGKLEALEDGQSKSGFTGLVLSLGSDGVELHAAHHSPKRRSVVEFKMFWSGVARTRGRRCNRSADRAYATLQCATNPG